MGSCFTLLTRWALPYLYEQSGRGCNTESPMLHRAAERGMTAKVIVAWGKCPLYPQKRTLGLSRVMSALCQKRTHAVQHKLQRRGNVRLGGRASDRRATFLTLAISARRCSVSRRPKSSNQGRRIPLLASG